MPSFQSIKFPSQSSTFFATLNKRVNEHFKSNAIGRHGNMEMVLKTAFMFSLYFIPYALIMTQVITGTAGLLVSCLVMGLGLAGIGLSVMHDANHGAYSSKQWVNDVMGYSLNLIGGNSINWKVQHNVLHHTYTNIHDADEDISPRGILRMSPSSEWRPIHRFQHWYAWFFYGLMTIVWVLVKDFVRIVKYAKEGLLQKQKTEASKEWIILISSKLIYITYMIVIPTLVLPLLWWQVVIGVLIMHYVGGFILAMIFQPAHVIDGTEYPLPNDDGNMENCWAIHQLHTTTNFANKSRLFSWYVGGLNYQVEHHLFPNICHVHYRHIAKIVEQTAHEFNIPYKSINTFPEAIVLHTKILKELGKKPKPAAKAVLEKAA